MAKNYIQKGENITVVAPYTVASGAGCMCGTLFGVAIADITIAEEGVLATEGVWRLTKAASDGGIALFGEVYWDASVKKVTGVAGGNQLIGTAMAVAATGAVTADVRLGIKTAPVAQTLLPVNFLALANGTNVSQVIFVATEEVTVIAISEVHTVKGTDSGAVSVTVERIQGTEALGAGDDLLTAEFDLKGTVKVVQAGVLTSTTAHLTLAAGDRLAVKYTGAITTLAGVSITAMLRAA